MDFLGSGDGEDGCNQQPIWKYRHSLHSQGHPLMAFHCHFQRRRRSCTPSQSLFLASVFHQGYYYLMSSVGVSASPPHTSSRQSSLIFAPCWTFIYFVSPRLIPLSCKNARPSSCSFVYLFGVLGGRCTHDGRTISVTRPTTSLVS